MDPIIRTEGAPTRETFSLNENYGKEVAHGKTERTG